MLYSIEKRKLKKILEGEMPHPLYVKLGEIASAVWKRAEWIGQAAGDKLFLCKRNNTVVP